MQDGNCTQTYQLGFSILNSSYPLAEMLAFGEGSVCRPSNTGREYYLSIAKILSIVVFPAVFTRSGLKAFP